MGVFSWNCAASGESISAEGSSRGAAPCVVVCPDNTTLYEPSYQGYAVYCLQQVWETMPRPPQTEIIMNKQTSDKVASEASELMDFDIEELAARIADATITRPELLELQRGIRSIAASAVAQADGEDSLTRHAPASPNRASKDLDRILNHTTLQMQVALGLFETYIRSKGRGHTRVMLHGAEKDTLVVVANKKHERELKKENPELNFISIYDLQDKTLGMEPTSMLVDHQVIQNMLSGLLSDMSVLLDAYKKETELA